MTVLYVMGHQGFLLNLMEYKMLVHPNEGSILLIDVEQAYRTDNIKLERVFDKVVRFNPSKFRTENDEGRLIVRIKEYYSHFLEENHINLEEMDKIYVQADLWNSFGVYLSLIKKKYYVFESCRGDSKHKIRYTMDRLKNATATFCDLQEKYGVLCGEGHELIKYGSDGFDYQKNIDSISNDGVRRIFSCFDLNVDDFSDLKQVLLLNSRGWVSPKTNDDYEVCQIYKKLMDFYSDEFTRIKIKTHPSEYSYLLDNFPHEILDYRPYNVEIIEFLQDLKLTFYCMQSTAIEKITKNKVVSCGQGFLYNSDIFESIFIFCKLAKYCDKKKIYFEPSRDLVFLKSLLNFNDEMKFVDDPSDAEICFMKGEFEANESIFCHDGCDLSEKIECMIHVAFIDHTDFKINRLEPIRVSAKCLDVVNYFTCIKHLKFLNRTLFAYGPGIDEKTMVMKVFDSLASWICKLVESEVVVDKHFSFAIIKKFGYFHELQKSLCNAGAVRTIENFSEAFPNLNLDCNRGLLKRSFELDKRYLVRYCSFLFNSKADSDYVELYKLCKNNLTNPDCKGFLGRLYSKGLGVEKNVEEAIVWFKSAVEYKKSWTVELCGVMLSSENPVHHKEAFDLCINDPDDVSKMALLGHMYNKGLGVKKDISLAYDWLCKASAHSDSW